MVFDSSEHKEICRQLIEGANFPGKLIELAVEFKQAVINAEVKECKKA